MRKGKMFTISLITIFMSIALFLCFPALESAPVNIAGVFNCAGRNGTFPHPLNTNKYIQCSKGIKVIMNCPDGQVFDNISKFCDWKSSTLYALENRGHSDPEIQEGDIIGLEQRKAAIIGKAINLPNKVNSARGSIYNGLWPLAVMYYVIDKTLADKPQAVKAIKDGMKEWSQQTCVKFEEKTTQTNYVTFRNGFGCSSHVGMQNRPQYIYLSQDCWYTGITAHEIGHALGLFHEQSRTDRDRHVTIKYENIIPGMEVNFKKFNASIIDSLGTPYDYKSIMHYTQHAFSKNGQPTIEAKQQVQVKLGNHKPSKIDIRQMNLLYRCGEISSTKVTTDTSGPITKETKGSTSVPSTTAATTETPSITKGTTSPATAKVSTALITEGDKQTTITTKVTTTTEPCSDLYSWCKDVALHCNEPSFQSFMEHGCKKTCKVCSGKSIETCGVRKGGNPRIVGGIVSARNAWPWMAQIANTQGMVFCGGSLISSVWVVTAAHCVSHANPSDVTVRLGAHFSDPSITTGTEQTFSLSKIITHPNYNTPLSLSNDIALLKLSRPASINDKVSPVCVPSDNSPFGFAPNKTCYVTGWGHLKFLGNFADQLMQARVPLQSNSTCRAAYPKLVDNSMVCAGPSQGGVDACQGDSGGPLVCTYNNRWYLEGVVSWGHGCAAPGKYGVYSKVRHLNDWIQQMIKSN